MYQIGAGMQTEGAVAHELHAVIQRVALSSDAQPTGHARERKERPGEQKQIIRILFMIPIYSVVSFLSYLYYRESVYFEVIRDCYEAFAISSFFALMCHYIAPNLHEQKEYFRSIQPKNWFWGVFGMQKCTGGENRGPFRRPRSGLTWFNVSIGDVRRRGHLG